MVLSCLALGAPQFPTLAAKRLVAAPIIDGVVSAEEWAEATKVDELRDRVTGQVPPRDKTSAYLAFDDKFIYVAFQCFDEEPEKIVGRELTPNAEFRGEDTVTFDINPFGTRAYDQLNEFIVNAIGTQTERLAGGRAGKREWRGQWKAATRRTEQGWECEMAIPWKMLNYPGGDKLNMDINLIRRQGRSLFEQSFANYRPNPLPELQGQWQGVTPPAPPKAKAQYLLYDALDIESGIVHNRIGADARIPLTPTVNSLISVAPDFQNIEDVVAGNDFVRIERFLNDPRPFFTEGSQFFDVNDRFSFGRLFYTRRIEKLDVGAKAFGQLNPKLAVGAMVAKEPDGTTSSVLKINNTVSGVQNQRAYVVTRQSGGNQNVALGTSFFKRWDTIGLSGELTAEKNDGEDYDTAGSFQFNYLRPTTRVTARYTWVEPNFAPALGFIPWTNRKGFFLFADINREVRKGPIRSYVFDFFASEYRTYDTNVVQQGGYSFFGELTGRNDMAVAARFGRETFSGSIDQVAGLDLTFNKTNRFRTIKLFYDNGIRQDEPSSYYGVEASWRIAENFDLGLKQSVLELGGADRQTIFTAQKQLAADQFITTRTVVLGDDINTYFSYRKAGNAGAEYYLIVGDPNARTSQNRLSFKVVWAF